MDYYQGSLRQFAEELLAKGRGNGQMVIVAQFDDAIIKDMNKKGVTLQSDSIVVTQQAVFKYAHHPKSKKGAVIPIEQYDLIENALKTPLHIYEDTAQKELVYVFTHPFEQSKLVKVVVHPNYRLNGKTIINAAKSWGFVSIESLENPQFVFIKYYFMLALCFIHCALHLLYLKPFTNILCFSVNYKILKILVYG